MITIRYDKAKKLACTGSIFVSFKYDPYIVNILRSYPDRFYDAKNREWELPQEALSYLQNKIEEKFIIEGEPKVDKKKKEKKYPLPKELKTKLYKFQEEDYQKMMNHDKFLLLNEMGLGKAACSISLALGRKGHNKVKHCLVITCVNGLKWDYLNQVREHTTATASAALHTPCQVVNQRRSKAEYDSRCKCNNKQ